MVFHIIINICIPQSLSCHHCSCHSCRVHPPGRPSARAHWAPGCCSNPSHTADQGLGRRQLWRMITIIILPCDNVTPVMRPLRRIVTKPTDVAPAGVTQGVVDLGLRKGKTLGLHDAEVVSLDGKHGKVASVSSHNSWNRNSSHSQMPPEAPPLGGGGPH